MNILIVSRRYYPDVIGGGQISAHTIAQMLVGAGVNVHVLTFTDNTRQDEVLDGVSITRLPIRKLRFFPRLSNLEWMYYEMARLTRVFMREFQPDVIHAMNGESIPSIAYVKQQTGIPFVATINGPMLLCFPGDGTTHEGKDCLGCRGLARLNATYWKYGRGSGVLGLVKSVLYWLYSYPHMAVLNWGMKRADMLLPVSTGVARDMRRLGYARLFPLHNPIAVRKKHTSRKKSAIGIPKRAPVLLYAGRLTWSKGPQQVIRALEHLDSVHAVIVGKGEDTQKLRQEARRCGVAHRVHMVGHVPHDTLDSYYALADIVIMAGTIYDTLGRMLLEACAAGIPVIGTDVAGNPDIIDHGTNGYLVQPLDLEDLVVHIRKILSNPALKKAMGRAAQKKVAQEFHPDVIVRQLISVYHRVKERSHK